MKILSFFLTWAIGFTVSLPLEASVGVVPCVTARSLVVYDPAEARILCAKNSNLKRSPASTTKIVTALVVMDKLRLDQVITVRKETAYVPRTKIYVRPGERFRVRDLLKALLISSSNDVAVVLAYQVSGSERDFARLMNRKARSLGARNTHFVNPHGLPADSQYSTSYDLALIMNKAQKYPFIIKTLAVKRTSIRSLAGRRFFLKNHNKMLWRDRRPVIGKTGYTRKALHCFVGRINYRKRDIVVALMGSIRPWHDLKVLLDFYSRVSVKRERKEITANKKHWSRRRLGEFERALKRAGFHPGPVDGILTSQSIIAIRAFQKRAGIPQTGFIGPLTSKRLKKLL